MVGAFFVVTCPPGCRRLTGHVQPAAAGAGRIQPPALTAEGEAAMLENLTADTKAQQL